MKDKARNATIHGLILEAQAALENLPMGAIGTDGATEEEIDKAEIEGHSIEDDASYHYGQKAWLILQNIREMIEEYKYLKLTNQK